MRSKMRTMLFRRVVVVALIAGVSLGICMNGCAPAAPTLPEALPIKVGVPEKITGPYASDAITSMRGIEMAIDDINAEGGLLGRPLEMVVFDIEDMTAEKIVASAEELILKEKVDVLISGYAGMGPDYEQYGKYDVPFFNLDSVSSCTDMVAENPEQYFNCFHLGPVDYEFGDVHMEAMDKFPYGYPNKRIGLIAADFEWEVKFTQLGMAPKARELGWEVVFEKVVPYGTTDYRPILAEMRAMDPPPALIWFEDMYPADTLTFLDQFLLDPTDTLLSLGYVVPFPEWLQLVGEKGEGIFGLGVPGPRTMPPEEWEDFGTPRWEESIEWIERYERLYDEKYTFVCAGVLYDALFHWAEAVEAVGDPSKHREICEYIAENPYEGLCATYDYDEALKLKMYGYPSPTVQIQNGEPVEVYSSGMPYPGSEVIMPPYLAEVRGLE